MLELIILLISIAIILYLIYNQDTEHFDNLISCPDSRYKQYLREKDGKIICYIGDEYSVIYEQCILNGSDHKIKQCRSSILEKYDKNRIDFCPKSLQNYFENDEIKGCTSGKLNASLNGPENINADKCIIYKTDISNITNKTNFNAYDSCINRKMKDEALQKYEGTYDISITRLSDNKPSLIEVKINTDTGAHISYTKDSLARYIDVVSPNWNNKDNFLKTNCMVTEVAKQQYIDSNLGTCT